MLTNHDIEARQEISRLIQSAQEDMSIANSLRVEAPLEAITRCEAAIDSFNQVLRLFIGETQYDDIELASIKDSLIKSYQLKADIHEQYRISKARHCYMQIKKLKEQNWAQYFSSELSELEDNDYVHDFDIEQTLEALTIDDTTQEEQLKLPNITMAVPENRSVAKDFRKGNHGTRMAEESRLEQITQSMGFCGLNDTDSDKEEQFTAEQISSLSPAKVKRGRKKSAIAANSAELHIDCEKLGELLNIAKDDTILAVWQHKVTEAIGTFLNDIKHKVVEGKKLKPRSVLISYYVDGNDELGIKKMTKLLAYLLQAINMPVSIKALTDNCADLEQNIQEHKLVIVLCDPVYAKRVERFPKIRQILDDFGKSKNDCLHTLLCDGGFADTALKVVDKYYLIRDYKLAFNREEIKDPLTKLLFLMEALFNTSGRDGLGVLPDLLNLKLNQHNIAKRIYKKHFKELEDVAQQATTEYRLRDHLEKCYQLNPAIGYLNALTIPCNTDGTAIKELLPIFQDNSPQAKTMLLICPKETDVALVNVALEQFLLESKKLTLTINCGDYPGKIAHQCVNLALRQLNFKNVDIEQLQRQEVIIILKNYERIGVYDNLYVKNKLSQWPKLKVIVTCRADFLERRDYKSYFLSDPADPKLETLNIHEIRSIEAPLELDRLLLSRHEQQKSLSAQTKDLQYGFTLNTKQQAQHDEFTYFLREINKLLVTKQLLQKQISKNPQLFISYAWETGPSLVRQQGHLRAIVKHLTTLGIPTWLDVERMTGNIDQQMASNIETSAFVMVIGTPKYAQRAMMETNVKKEYDTILKKTRENKLKTISALFFDERYDVCLIPEEYHVYLISNEPSPEQLPLCNTPSIVYNPDNTIKCLILKINNNIQKIEITIKEQTVFKDFIKQNVSNKSIPKQGLKVSLINQRLLLSWLMKKSYNPFTEKLKDYSAPTLVYSSDKKVTFLVLKEQELTLTLQADDQTIFADFMTAVNQRTTISDKGLSVSLKDQSQILSWLKSKGYKPFTDKLGSDDPAIVIYPDSTKITVLQEHQEPKIIEISDAEQDSAVTQFIKQSTKSQPTTQVPLKISLNINNPLIPWLTAKGCRPSQFKDLLEHAKSISHSIIDLRNIEDSKAYIEQLTETLIPSLLDLKSPDNQTLYEEYKQQLAQLHKRLAFLPAEHLIVDIGQDLVQAYDIDNRLKIYIKPQICRYVPVIISANQKLDKTDQNKIYLEKNSDGTIKYTIIKDKPISATITKEQLLSLNPATQDLLTQLNQNFNLDNIKPLLPYILKIAATNQHIIADDAISEDQLDLQKSFEAFLAKETTEAKNYVVLGEAGSGKTLFTLWVFKELLLKEWHGYKKKKARLRVYDPPKWLPVYIPLKLYASEKAEECINKALGVYELDREDIESLKQGLGTEPEQGVVFILDGYDELSEASRKDYTAILASWTHSKVLLTSRPEHFNRQSNSEEHYIAPLSDNDKQEFIKQYKEAKPDTKLDSVNEVFKILQNMPSLMPLLDNPFLLNLVLQVLPELLKSKTQNQDITRADIYQAFTNLWFTKESIRHTDDPATTEECQEFAELLSFKMRQAKTISVTSGADNDLSKFFDASKKGTRLSCPLQRTGQEYGYIHKSLYEFFLSKALYLEKNQQELTKPIFYAKTLIDEPSVLRFSMEIRTPRNVTPKGYHSHRTQLFLNLVGWGEQEAAERMLQVNPELAHAHGDLTDCGLDPETHKSRTWYNITAFQYAVLVLDYHMWTMLQKYMGPQEIRAQLEELNSVATLNNEAGWIIKEAIEVHKWPCASWATLIAALDKYIQNYDGNTWRQQVGGAQLILPAHVINEYSHPTRPFYPCPKWEDSEAALPRTGVSDWREADNGKYILGTGFAWCRADWRARRGSETPRAKYDRAAVSELLRARVEQARRLLLEPKLDNKTNSQLRLT